MKVADRSITKLQSANPLLCSRRKLEHGLGSDAFGQRLDSQSKQPSLAQPGLQRRAILVSHAQLAQARFKIGFLAFERSRLLELG